MPDTIRDGKGRGYLAAVTSGQRLNVESVAESIQHAISRTEREAYQIIGMATLSSGTTVALHIKNTSETKDLVMTYVRFQIVDESGGTAVPNASNYYRMAFDREYSSGGATASSVNVNTGVSSGASITAYQSNPTLSGTASEFDRYYPKDNAQIVFRKEGAVIIAPSGTLELSYVGDQSSGTLYTRLSFIMREQP